MIPEVPCDGRFDVEIRRSCERPQIAVLLLLTMKFGKKLLSSQFPPWSHYYLDYKRLKQVLEAEDSEAGHKRSASNMSRMSILTRVSMSSHPSRQLHHPNSEKFLYELNFEVEKIVLFTLQEQGRIAYQLQVLR